MARTGTEAFCERLASPLSIFDSIGPRDSGPCAIWDRENNIWYDDNGVALRDLTEMGFSPWMRETILLYIHQHEEDKYVGLVNDFGDSIELFWSKGEDY